MQQDRGIARRRVLRWDAAGERSEEDALAVEAALAIRCGGRTLAVVLRTPGHDLELARGMLFAEGALLDAAEAAAVREARDDEVAPHERGHVVMVDLDPARIASRWPGRALPASSACGACGGEALAGLAERASPVLSDVTAPRALLAALPERLRRSQQVFDATGGLHAAGLFTAGGELLGAREDVGRHNAVDKLVGGALLDGQLPLSQAILCVSGRLGYEIVHKAICAGVPLIAAVSAPSSLAVDLAERYRVTVCGFARGDRLNVYSHAGRVV